jgi:hypothetical protein
MKTPCEQIRQWLDNGDRPPLPAALEAHVGVCPVCRRSVTVERALRQGLRAGAALDAARRSALMEKIAGSPSGAAIGRRSRRLLRWSWAALAAAAAIILAVVLTWPPAPRTPILPTELFGDFLGPLAEMSPPEENIAPAAPAESSTTEDVLGAFWADFEGPLSVALGAMEAPRAAARPAPEKPVKE